LAQFKRHQRAKAVAEEHVAHSEVLQAGDGGPEDDDTGASLVFGAAGAVER